MTARAKRLEFYLRTKLDWNTQADRRNCTECDARLHEEHEFCWRCGEKAPEREIDKQVITELEKAIKYALRK